MISSQKSSLTVAVAQPFCLPGDVEGNLSRMEPLVRQAGERKARLVVFSEAGVTGYEADERSVSKAVTLGDATCLRLQAMAARHDTVIAAGFIERWEEKRFVSHGMFYPDGKTVVQRKAAFSKLERAIPGWEAGPVKREVFEVEGVRCAVAICADFGLKGLWEDLIAQGVQLLILTSASCGKRSWGVAEKELENPAGMEKWLKTSGEVLSATGLMKLCRMHRIAIIGCNQMADDGVAYFHPGNSSIVDSTGELLALIPGVTVFEHLRERMVTAHITAQTPRPAPFS